MLRSTLLWNLIAMLLVVIAAIVGAWFWMNKFTHHGESIEVPNVKGMVLSDAEYALTRAQLEAVVTDSGYNRKLPAGTVLEQIPASGRQVKSGREVYLTINSGQTPTMALPDIADNCSLREANGNYSVYDLWQHKTIAKSTSKNVVSSIPSHGVLMVKLLKP